MSQGTLSVGNLTFPAFRGTMNGAFDALKTNNSGTSAPGGAALGMAWVDTATGTRPILKMSDGSEWIEVTTFDTNANRAYRGTQYAAAGGSGAPSHSFEGDTDTGWYLKGTNSIGEQVGGVDVRVMSSAGEQTLPLQPAFLATVGTSVANVTGDGTDYTLNPTVEIFDQGGDFSAPTFTAPVTGRYLLGASVSLEELGAAHVDGFLRIDTSNRTYYLWLGNPGAIRRSTNDLVISGFVVADMDAADTATVVLDVTGSTKTVDVSALATRFSGALFA